MYRLCSESEGQNAGTLRHSGGFSSSFLVCPRELLLVGAGLALGRRALASAGGGGGGVSGILPAGCSRKEAASGRGAPAAGQSDLADVRIRPERVAK